MANELIKKWSEYYERNGLRWLASQHVAAIKQAFFAGAEAVEQSVHPTLLESPQETVDCPNCGFIVDIPSRNPQSR